MECKATIVVGSLDAWLPSCGESDSDVLSRPGRLLHCHETATRARGVASASSSAAPVPIPFSSRAAAVSRSCSPRSSPVAQQADSDDDEDDGGAPLDSDFLECLARKQHSFLTQAMAARRGGGSGGAAADREAAAGASGASSSGCCEADGSGVSGGGLVSGCSSMWASSSAASSVAVRSVGWSINSSGSGSAFSNSMKADACDAFGSLLAACGKPAAPPGPGATMLLAKAAAATPAVINTGGHSGCGSNGSGSASSCISEGTVRRGRPRLTISSACSLPLPPQSSSSRSVHSHQPQLGSLCKALSSPDCPQSLASAIAQPHQHHQHQQQQRSFERILPPPAPTASHAPALHSGSRVDHATVVKGGNLGSSSGNNGGSGSGSHAASEAAAAAAAFALSMCSLPDHSSSSGDDDSEGYESCSDRDATPQQQRSIRSRRHDASLDCGDDDDDDDIDLSLSCGSSSVGGGAPGSEPLGPLLLDGKAPAVTETVEASARVVLAQPQPQLAAMRLCWLQSIANACGVMSAAGAHHQQPPSGAGAVAASAGGSCAALASSASPIAATAPRPLPRPGPGPTPAAAAPQHPVHMAMAASVPDGALTPISTRRGLFEGTVSGGSPRNAWQWHGAAAGSQR